MSYDYSTLINSVVLGDEGTSVGQVAILSAGGASPLDIINEGLLKGMDIVSAKFKQGEMFIPEVLMSSKAMNAGMELVKPHIAAEDMPSIGTVVIGTVQGDLHDIGKNLVVMMMESAGFKVINLGVDASKEDFVKAVKENGAQIVAMSAMLTTTMEYMSAIIDACKEENLDVAYMIGGAPVSDTFANRIKAEYTADSAGAVDRAKAIMGV